MCIMNFKNSVIRKVIVVAVLFLVSVFSEAQIADEINSMVDSNEVIINNGRKLLVKSFKENNLEKASQVYYYLLTAIDDTDCVAFEYYEQLLITSLTSDWFKWLELAENIQEYKKPICYPDIYNNFQSLYQLFKEQVETKIEEEKDIPEEGKLLLDMYLYLIKKGIADEEYNEKLKFFKSNYPQSKYLNFVNFYLPGIKVKTSFAMSLGASQTFQTSKLGEMFSPGTMGQMSLDLNINKTYVSLYFSGGSLRLQKPFDVSFNNIDTTFNKDERFSYVEGGLKLGYFLLRNSRVHFSPYASISGNSLKSDIYDSNENKEDDELKIINSFLCGAGVHTEFKLFEFTTKGGYYSPYPLKNYISLKIDLGYNLITKNSYDTFKGNMFYIQPTLVWGVGSF